MTARRDILLFMRWTSTERNHGERRLKKAHNRGLHRGQVKNFNVSLDETSAKAGLLELNTWRKLNIHCGSV